MGAAFLIWQFTLVAIGGALGAMARYGTTILVHMCTAEVWPLATLLVNITGSIGIGVVFTLLERGAIHTDTRSLLVTGFFGAFTTFSAFSLELLRMIERGEGSQASIYAAGSLLSCLVGVALGVLVTRALTWL